MIPHGASAAKCSAAWHHRAMAAPAASSHAKTRDFVRSSVVSFVVSFPRSFRSLVTAAFTNESGRYAASAAHAACATAVSSAAEDETPAPSGTADETSAATPTCFPNPGKVFL